VVALAAFSDANKVRLDETAAAVEGEEISLQVAVKADDAKNACSVRFEQSARSGEEEADSL
jgi:transposase-like protein